MPTEECLVPPPAKSRPSARQRDVPPEDVRTPIPTEELSAKVAAANRRWGRAPRSVLRHWIWTLQPDRKPDAEPGSYAMKYTAAGETPPPSEDAAEPQDWVLRHCGQNPSQWWDHRDGQRRWR
ncbi:hypothetical protein [Streptomyces sp. NPDC088789]|uniref:DUF7848 domain-containing protein n=1 Tax=Streptomyces sp. NPDC088789 TaxID=3365899 RepID=UPI00382F2AB0